MRLKSKNSILTKIAKKFDLPEKEIKLIYDTQFKTARLMVEQGEVEMIRLPRIGKLVKKQKKDVR
jgi:hypothetical protein